MTVIILGATFETVKEKGAISMTERNETMLRLVLWRKRMTQADLARRTGIDPASVSRIVRGVEPAYPRRGKRIADALGWEGDPAKLFEEVPDVEDR